ncbi:hypothetical protein WDW86_08345 [Bdellovibrionota bacterium FG-2]
MTFTIFALLQILLIGDSHTVGTFGKSLNTLLATLPSARVQTYGSCGSSPSWWIKGTATSCGYFSDIEGNRLETPRHATPILSQLLKNQSTDVVVIALGSNLMPDTLEHARQTTQELLGIVSKHKEHYPHALCFWIAPPNGRNKTEPKFGDLYAMLQEETQGICQLFDSRMVTHYPATGGDGAHFDSLGPEGREIAKHWAQSAFGLIRARVE